jgi:hypothetical protein
MKTTTASAAPSERSIPPISTTVIGILLAPELIYIVQIGIPERFHVLRVIEIPNRVINVIALLDACGYYYVPIAAIIFVLSWRRFSAHARIVIGVLLVVASIGAYDFWHVLETMNVH